MRSISHKTISATLFTGCFFLFSCENDPTMVNNINQKNIGTELATDIRINYTTGGKTKAVLTAPLMIHAEETGSYYEFPNTLYAEFYNEQEQKETKLTALYGKYKDGESIIYLRDSVKIINMLRGDTIYCEDLWWDRSRTGVEFYTEKKVSIRQKDGQYMNGSGMEASQSFKNYHMIRPSGVINSGGTGFPR